MTLALRFLGVGSADAVALGSSAAVLERDGGCGAFFCWRRTGSFDFALRAPLRMTNRETLGTSHPVIPSAGDGVAGVATRS